MPMLISKLGKQTFFKQSRYADNVACPIPLATWPPANIEQAGKVKGQDGTDTLVRKNHQPMNRVRAEQRSLFPAVAGPGQLP